MIRHEVDAWDTERQKKREKMEAIYQFSDGKVVKEDQIKQLLETAIRPGETVAIEGDNQKQAVQLSKGLATVDPKKVNGLHIVMSCTQMQEHLDIFELGIAEKLDFSYAGNAAKRLPEMIEAGTVKVGAIHTYLEMFSRMFTDLIPNVCLCVAEEADRTVTFTPDRTQKKLLRSLRQLHLRVVL